MFYNFDINKWIAMIIPRIIRRKFLYALLKAMLYPVMLIYSAFVAYRKDIEGRLSYNAFTIYLAKFLNDLLLTDGIYIIDHIIEQTIYLSLRKEGDAIDYFSMKDESADPTYVSNSDSLIGGFTIMVPGDIATPENLSLISRWVDYYRYAGTQFNIKTY